VLEVLERYGVQIPVLQLGLPDRFIDQGDPGIQLGECGLTAEGIVQSVRERLRAVRRNAA
jgi:1-deoxy-D-xylulose-5-phosphate synthase